MWKYIINHLSLPSNTRIMNHTVCQLMSLAYTSDRGYYHLTFPLLRAGMWGTASRPFSLWHECLPGIPWEAHYLSCVLYLLILPLRLVFGLCCGIFLCFFSFFSILFYLMILLLLLLSCLIYFEELCCIFGMEGKIKGTCLVFQMDLNSSGAWGCSIDLAFSRELVLNCTALIRAAGRCCGCTWVDGWGHIQTSWSADLSRLTLRVRHWSKSHSFHLVPLVCIGQSSEAMTCVPSKWY